MMKVIVCCGFLMLFSFFIFPEEAYIASDDIVLYANYNPIFGTVITFEKGTILNFTAKVIQENARGSYMLEVETKDGLNGWIDTDLITNEELETLPSELINTIWTHSYYLDVLRSRRRETLLRYEPFWGMHHDSKYQDTYGEGGLLWYNVALASKINLKNTFITVDDMTLNIIQFLNEKTVVFTNSISIYSKCLYKDIIFEEAELPTKFQMNESYVFHMIIDGDYLEVLMNNEKLFTLFKVTDDFEKTYKRLIEDNDYFDYGFQWPRRADGSMDYPPPQPTQATATEQPEVVDIADYGEAAEPDPVEETVGRQQATTGFPWVAVLVIAGVALVGGLTAFVVLRKKK
ncbi:MAG: hypothetical protein LBS55_07100 [Prevotellaceae bacterium]|jgi:hypothetical protein|nr:hypothetical protein [Prevotellaceae bacterium]